MRNKVRTQAVDPMVAIPSPIVLVVAWEMLVRSGAVSAYAFSQPSMIALAFGSELVSSDFWGNVGASLVRLVGGIGLGVTVGIAFAFLTYLNTFVRSAFGPIMRFAASFPPMVWAPPVIALLGTAELSKIVFIAIASSFVQFSATYRGLVSIDGRLLEALSAFPRPISTQIKKIYWPGALPHILDGLKLSMTFGWIALLFAEMMGSENGLGWMLWDARTFGRASEMMVALLTIGVLGKLSVDGIDRLARRMSPWYGQFRVTTLSGGKLGTASCPERFRV